MGERIESNEPALNADSVEDKPPLPEQPIKKPAKKKNPTEILEKRGNVGVEGAYSRHPGEEFKDMSHSAGRSEVILDYSRLESGKPYTSLHTHPFGPEDVQEELVLGEDGRAIKGPNIPSESDMRDFLQRPDEKVMIIAQQDPKTGEVSGYLFIKKTSKTQEIPKVPINKADLDKAPDEETRSKLMDEFMVYGKLPEVRKLERDLYNYYHGPSLFEGDYDPEKDRFIPKKDAAGKLVERNAQSGRFYVDLMNKFMERYGLQFRAAARPGFYYEEGIGFKRK